MKKGYCDGMPLQPPFNGILGAIREELNILRQQQAAHQALCHSPSFTLSPHPYTRRSWQWFATKYECGFPIRQLERKRPLQHRLGPWVGDRSPILGSQSHPRDEEMFWWVHHLQLWVVGPLRAVSFFCRSKEEEEYDPWHRLVEAEMMVRSQIKISWQLTSFLSPFLPLFRP